MLNLKVVLQNHWGCIRKYSFTILWLVSFLILSNNTAKAVTISEDAEIYGVVRQIADPLLKEAGFDPKGHEIYIIDDDTVNAFTDSSQDIYIYTGIIELCDISMLRGVLAHEISHISHFHVPQKVDELKNARVMELASLVTAFTLSSMANSNHDKLGIFTSLYSFGNMASRRSFLSASRLHEIEADKGALNLLNGLGYSGQGLLDLLRKFKSNKELIISENQIISYEQTHPLDGTRYNLLRDKVKEEEGLKSRTPGQDEITEKLYKRVREKLKTLNNYSNGGNLGELENSPYLQAALALQKNIPSKALGACHQLINQDSSNAYNFYLRSVAYLYKGQYRKAHEDIKTANKLDTGNNILLRLEEKSITLSLLNSLIEQGETENNSGENQKPLGLDKKNRNLLKNTIVGLERLRLEMNDSLYIQLLHSMLVLAYDINGETGKVKLNLARAALNSDYRQAHKYANEALDYLEKDSPAYIAAEDIIRISKRNLLDLSPSHIGCK